MASASDGAGLKYLCRKEERNGTGGRLLHWCSFTIFASDFNRKENESSFIKREKRNYLSLCAFLVFVYHFVH